MHQWKEVTLDEIADLTVGFVGKTATHYVDKGVRFIRSMNVEPFRINYNDPKFVDQKFHNKIKKSELNVGDVVIVRTGKPGACAVIPRKSEEWNCADLVVVKPKHEYVNSTYLAAFINLAYGVINAHLVGAVQQHFNVGSAKKLKIKLPPIDVQDIVGSFIDNINAKIEVNETINKNLEQQAQAIFKSWFVDFEPFNGEMPHDWIASRLGDIASIKTNSFSPVKNPDAQLEHYSIPAYDEQKYPVFESAAGVKSNKYILSKNSVMISKLNPDTKRVWRPMCLSELAVSSTEFIIFEAFNPAYRDFVFSIIDSAAFSDWMCAHTTGSTNSRQRTAPSATLEFQVALPDEKAITDFCAIVTPMYDTIASNICENQKLAQLRDSILPKLMSGELDVSEIEF